MRASPVLNKYACKKQCITFDFWAEKRMMILDNLGVAQVTTETFVLTIIIFEKKKHFCLYLCKILGKNCQSRLKTLHQLPYNENWLWKLRAFDDDIALLLIFVLGRKMMDVSLD